MLTRLHRKHVSFGGTPEFEARPRALEAGWPTSSQLRERAPQCAHAISALLCSRSVAGRQGKHRLDLAVPPHRGLASGEVAGVVVISSLPSCVSSVLTGRSTCPRSMDLSETELTAGDDLETQTM